MASPARQELLNDGRDATLNCRDGRLHQAGRCVGCEVDDEEEEEEKGQRTKAAKGSKASCVV